MYLLYADESGDAGLRGMGKHFILSAIIIHESRWSECFRILKDLRTTLKEQYGIKRNAELHANKNIAGRGALWQKKTSVQDRVRLFQLVMEAIARMPDVKTISVCVHKDSPKIAGKSGHQVYEAAWTFLLQRFHTFIEKNRHKGSTECGLVVHDQGHDVEIRRLMRKLRIYNPVPSQFGGSTRNIPLTTLIEDPVSRDSFHAQFIQLCDYLAFALLRQEEPVAKYPGLSSVFGITTPVMLKEASTSDPQGVVRFPR